MAARRTSLVAIGEQCKLVGNRHTYQDRNLAANIGIGFKTPEEFFLDEDPQPWFQEFDPVAFLAQQVVPSKTPRNLSHFSC